MNAFVVPHDPAWSKAFDCEANAIRHALDEVPIVLHHIGSTAIPDILAKPIIDMLGVVDDLETIDRCSAAIRGLGYEVMGPFGIEGRRYFRKFDADGRRTHHLHVFATGSSHIERHLAFRDYLRSNRMKAAEYSDLKAKITSGTSVPWDEYMDAKDPFVAETERQAVNWYRKKIAAEAKNSN